MSPFFLTYIMKNFFDTFPTPYPYDVKDRIDKGLRISFDLTDELDFLFPLKKNNKKLNVLIVGCGYNEAIFRSMRSPKFSFTGIDNSIKAIEHHSKQIKDYKIKNLKVVASDILDFNDDKFDVIYCLDFLSYQKKPLNTLKHLSSLLHDDGIILMSVDTSLYFNEVNLIRNIFLDLGYSYDNKEDIHECFEVIKKFDAFHPSRIAILNMPKRSVEIDNFIDINEFASRFLRPVHNSFSVKDVFDLIDKSGLTFQSWYDNSLYYPSIVFSPYFMPNFTSKLSNLKLINQWDAVCSIKGAFSEHYKHTFAITKNLSNSFVYEELFKDHNSLVSLRPYQNITTASGTSGKFIIRSNFKKQLTDNEEILCDLLSKPKSIKSIISSKRLDLNENDVLKLIKDLYYCSVIYFKSY